MPMAVVNFFERIPQIREGESADGRSHIENGRGRAKSKNHRKEYGDANAQLQSCSSLISGYAASNRLRTELRFLIPRTRLAFHL
jgi:hypothetical protein